MPFVDVEIDGINHQFISATGFSDTSGTVILTRKFDPKDMRLTGWYEQFKRGTAVKSDITIMFYERDNSEGGRRNLSGCVPCAYEVSDPGMVEQTESIALNYKDAHWG
jgi:hypothetical protein